MAEATARRQDWGAGLGLVAYLASAAFLHLSYQRYFWIVLALASSAIWALRRDRAEGVPEHEAAGAAR